MDDDKGIEASGFAEQKEQACAAYMLEQFGKQMRRKKAIVEEMPVLRKDGTVFYAESVPLLSH